MNQTWKELQTREKKLAKELSTLEKQMENMPKESLQVSPKGDKHYYYERAVDERGGIHRRYLRKDELKQITQLALKRYTAQRMYEIRKELEGIRAFYKHYGSTDFTSSEEFLYELPAYASVLQPVIKPMPFRAKQWAAAGVPSEYRAEEKIHSSKNGLPVRSKAEAMIASSLEERDIPFRYEERVQLRTRKVIPDFTIMSPVNGHIIYWEHLGMMDDGEYSAAAIDKLMMYQENGLILGKDLFITMEASSNPLTYKQIDWVIENMLDATFYKGEE